MDVTESLDRNGKAQLEVTTEKNNVSYGIRRTNDGFIFYEIIPSKGPLPAALSGYYISMGKALDTLKRYLDSQPKSKKVRVKEDYEARHAATAG